MRGAGTPHIASSSAKAGASAGPEAEQAARRMAPAWGGTISAAAPAHVRVQARAVWPAQQARAQRAHPRVRVGGGLEAQQLNVLSIPQGIGIRGWPHAVRKWHSIPDTADATVCACLAVGGLRLPVARRWWHAPVDIVRHAPDLHDGPQRACATRAMVARRLSTVSHRHAKCRARTHVSRQASKLLTTRNPASTSRAKQALHSGTHQVVSQALAIHAVSGERTHDAARSQALARCTVTFPLPPRRCQLPSLHPHLGAARA